MRKRIIQRGVFGTRSVYCTLDPLRLVLEHEDDQRVERLVLTREDAEDIIMLLVKGLQELAVLSHQL